MKLTDNTVFITGGTSGIGRALAEALHSRGNQVIVAGRRQALLDEIAADNPGMDTVLLDIGDPAQIKAVAAEVIARHPNLNVVINNAGIMPFDDAGAGDLDDAQAVQLVTTNLLGPVLAFLPLAATALYSATKAALHSYTLSQRFQLRDTSVQVLEIAPPWVDTDLVHKSGDSRAMPLDDFIAETLDKLATAETEVLVDRVVPLRANPGLQEHALINQFNLSLVENPIPVA